MNQAEVAQSFKPDYARRHGCAWFVWGQDPVHHPESTGGWASLGGEPAFEFHRPQDLPKDVIWWTNLSKSEAWSLGRWSHIKHAGFLGPDWLTLMSEWGFPQELIDLKTSVATWSEVFARLGEWLSRWNTKTDRPGSGPHPDWSWGDGEWHDVLADRMGWVSAKDDAHPALAVAYLDQVDQEFPAQKLVGQRKISIPLPRAAHARALWSTRFPTGRLQEVLPSEWPTAAEQRWSWLAAQKLPVLVRFDEVLWKTGQEDMASLWWGLRGRRFAAAAMDPVWVTAEEALEMREWIDADPAAALRADGWTRADDVPHWPILSPSVLDDNSITSGLLGEALWRAAATPVRTPTKRIKSGVSLRAVWWRAADRRSCFAAARAFRSKGFSVLSYGQGCVTVLFNPQTTLATDWVSAIQNSGVQVPMMLAQHMPQDTVMSAASVDVWMKKLGSMETWLWLDRLLWPWMSPDKHAIKPILEHAMRSLAAPPAPTDAWSKEWKLALRARAKTSVQAIVEPPV